MEEEIRPEERVQLKKIYKARLTIASMMRQRGYLEPSNSIDEKQSYEEFEANKHLRGLDEYLYFKASDYNQKMYVAFERDRKVEEDRIVKLEQRIKQGHMNSILLVLNGDPNNGNIVEKKARTKIELFNQEFKFYSIELFNIDDLVFDITKHELVPQHIPISDDEKKALLIKYRMTEAQLPRILLSDPMAKFLGLKHGNVVKIVRKSETAGVYVTYRIAI